MLNTGVILAERYRLDAPIAAGGVGQVWRGTDLLLQRPVAVKLLRPEYAEHPETLERFRAEARHAGSLTHPCIAQVHDYGDGDSAQPPFLVMELVDGPSLADVLAAEPVSPARALDVITKAATGLAAAHRSGLVHRDLKPGNILLGPAGQVKISDFGVAHAAGSAPLTHPGLVMGTTQYLAPERIAGGPATPASDMYAMGIVLHECLTGAPPFEGTPAEVMAGHLYLPLPPVPAGTPAEVEELISRLTCKDPAERLSDADDLAAIAGRLAAAAGAGKTSPPRQRPESAVSPRGASGPRTVPGSSSAGGLAVVDGTGTRPSEPGTGTGPGRAARGFRGQDPVTRRRTAVASGLLLLGAASVAAVLLANGGQHPVAGRGHAVESTSLGVVQPSVPGAPGTVPSPRSSAGPPAAARTEVGQHPGHAVAGTGGTAATPTSSPATSPPSTAPSTHPSAAPSVTGSPPVPAYSPPSAQPKCGNLLSCIGL